MKITYHWILDKNGEPIPASSEQWCDWFEKGFMQDNRRVSREKVGGYEVSTVFLGIDHNYGAGPPVLWETMIFGPGPLDQHQERCSGSREQAEAMHARMVKKVKAKKSKVKK